MNQEKLSTAPVPTADTKNSKADNINSLLRPYLSLQLPENPAPTKQPNKALLIAQPRNVAESSIMKNGS